MKCMWFSVPAALCSKRPSNTRELLHVSSPSQKVTSAGGFFGENRLCAPSHQRLSAEDLVGRTVTSTQKHTEDEGNTKITVNLPVDTGALPDFIYFHTNNRRLNSRGRMRSPKKI